MNHVREAQEFFATRAARWEERFPDDGPRYRQAVQELHIRPGAAVLDAGCGTGRALPFLRDAAGSNGIVAGLDVTFEMLTEACRLGRQHLAWLILADGASLPFRDRSFQVVFAAGFLPHLPEPRAGLAELARVSAIGGTLGIFHPISRAALAERHGGAPSDDDVISPKRLPGLLQAAGWRMDSLDDSAERYLALATRV